VWAIALKEDLLQVKWFQGKYPKQATWWDYSQLKSLVGTRRSYGESRRNSRENGSLRGNILLRDDMLGFLMAHINAHGARSYGQEQIS